MLVFWLCLVLLIFCAAWISARIRHKARYPQVLYGFADTFTSALLSRQALWVFASSVLVTAFLALTELDWTFQRYMQITKPLGYEAARFFLVWGNFWHPAAALLLLICARLGRLRALYAAAAAAAQAMLIQVIVVTALKIISGRRGPLNPDIAAELLYFRKTTDPADFAFEFWEYGFADGRFFWPSGHTATAFSFAAAFTFALCRHTAGIPVRVLAVFFWLLAALTGFAMVEGDFHWTSDVLAGAAIGTFIGARTGRAYRLRYPGSGQSS
jgi:membrane-associated phospholipid phosphatase